MIDGNNCRAHMPLSLVPERFAVIRTAMYRLRTRKLATEVAAEDPDHQSSFVSVDEFLKYADALVKQPKTSQRRSRRIR